MDNMVILAYDGDNAGRLVGRAILADDADGLHEVSNRIAHGHDIVQQWAQANGGQIISGGGDEGVFQVPQQALGEIESLRKDYEFATQLTMTVGVGRSLSEAGKALMVGKFRGKNQVVQYDDSVEADMASAQQHIADGSASQEENKIGEAYMNKEQPEDMGAAPLAQAEGAAPADDHSDCPYCQELDGATEHSSDCQYCAEYDAKQGAGATGDESLDNCPYCQEMHSEADHQHGDDCVHCQEYDAKQAQAQPADAQAAPDALAQNPELTPQGNTPNESQESPQGSQEILPPKEVLQGLDQEGQEALPQEEVNSNIVADATGGQPDNGALMEDGVVDGVSRPAGYDDNTPGDMGLAEEEDPQQSPDLSQVLQGGLDQHADSIQKEKVVDMVSQALEGFKSQKQILERAKDQAPQLYSSCIMMLKAMIEMTKMLGLNQGQADANDPLGDQAAAQPEQQAQPAAPQEGAAQPPKPVGQ